MCFPSNEPPVAHLKDSAYAATPVFNINKMLTLNDFLFKSPEAFANFSSISSFNRNVMSSVMGKFVFSFWMCLFKAVNFHR